MREISNHQDIIDTRDIQARIDELEAQQTDRWVAGWNMPGYLPDSEPAEFEDFDDAKEYIADEIERAADQLEEDADLLEELQEQFNKDEAEKLKQRAVVLREDADKVRKLEEGDFGTTLGRYHYWITLDGKMGLDDDETQELAALQSLKEEAEGYCDWDGGEGLIRDDYFETYAQEFAYDIGAAQRDAGWPPIDWAQAAEELQQDYATVDFDGETYWVRCC